MLNSPRIDMMSAVARLWIVTSILSIFPGFAAAQTGKDTHYLQHAAIQEYVVVGKPAVLYSSPAQNSRAIGEFRSEAIIAAVSVKNGWVEVDRPEHGYIPLSSLAEVTQEPHASSAREREFEATIKQQEERIRDLERQLANRNSTTTTVNSGSSEHPPLGAVSSGTKNRDDRP